MMNEIKTYIYMLLISIYRILGIFAFLALATLNLINTKYIIGLVYFILMIVVYYHSFKLLKKVKV